MIEWAICARTARHRRALDSARALVREALSLGPAYVAVSGGKDSVALLGIVREIAPDLPAWHIDSGMETPETLAVLAQVCGLRTASPALDIATMAEMVGAWGYTGPKKLPGQWHWSDSDWKRILIDEPSAALCAEHGYRVVLTGCRADESRARGKRVARWGAIKERKDGIVHAWPLAYWTGLDSLAYCHQQGLPISGIYLGAGAEPADRRRTGTILGGTYARHGRYADLKMRHPLLWHQLVDRFPALRAFA
jgi:phosphoadenosine phosphosulfate reductase